MHDCFGNGDDLPPDEPQRPKPRLRDGRIRLTGPAPAKLPAARRSLAEKRDLIGDTPMRVLMAIAAGEKMVSGSKIVLAPNGKPRMSEAFAYPTLKERRKAATALLSRVMPSLQAAALQMDATVAGDVKHSVEPHNPLLVAQALALLIHDGVIDPAPIRALIDQPRGAQPVSDAAYELAQPADQTAVAPPARTDDPVRRGLFTRRARP